MAAGEARAILQRTANRCFVQEDAKRAPKLACCQSSCATSKSVDAGPASAANESNQFNVNAVPFNRKSSFSNLSPASKWWLQSQPNYGYQKCPTYENLNSSLMDELETLKALDGNEIYKGEVTQFGDESHHSSSYMHCDFETNDAKKVFKDKMQEAYIKNSEEYCELSDMRSKHETVEINPVGCSVSKKTNDSCLGSDCSWIESDKTEPWWRTTDRDELAFFVSQKSLSHFENCDLPPPQKKYLRRHPCNAKDDKIKTSSFDWEAQSSGSSNLSVHVRECLNPNLMHGNQRPSAKEEILHSASNKSSSTTEIHDESMEKQKILEGDPSRAQLMEALDHSQKRAREAEEAVRQAYAEKEDLVKFFFKQASQIFAYKQWLQLLQLETLYFQANSKDQLVSTLFPTALPSKSCNGRKTRKRKQNFGGDSQEMQDQAKTDVTTYAVAFALGLSLVGAGILLGWTVGWMSPHL